MNYATTKVSSSGTTVGCEDSEIENEYANGSALPFAATGGKCILEKDNDSSNTITKGDYVKCGAEATGRLISYEELIDLGCMKDTHSCENAPAWASQTSYWTGSAGDSSLPWYILNGEFNNDSYFNEILFGLRPVIELNESVIEK